MSKIINYSTGLRVVKNILKNEGINMKPKFQENFLFFLGKICSYEEEEVKIKPLIIVGNNLDEFFIQCPPHYKSVIFEDDFRGSNFARIMKSMIPLCKNNWYVFVNFSDQKVQYGIFRKFQSPVSVNFEEMFFDKVEMEQKGMVCIKPYEKNSFILKSLCTEETVITFGFKAVEEKPEEKLNQMKEDMISLTNLNTIKSNYVDNALKRVLSYMPSKVHGSLCLIVKPQYRYPNDYLGGLVIDPPLDLVECIVLSENMNKHEESERYYALTNLFYEFMNIDGIVIVNAEGKVIGYNAFYRSSSTPTNKEGGARKRTFLGLEDKMKEKDSDIIGVYYQSQDGNFEYKRRVVNE